MLVGVYIHKHNDNDNDKDVAQHGSHTPAHSYTVACSLGLQHTSDTGQSMLWSTDMCQNNVSDVPVSADHIAGSSLELVKVTCVFFQS